MTAREPVSITAETRARPMRVTRSLLAAEAVLQAVTEDYAIGDPQSCQFLLAGLNDTYLLRTREERYIVRVYRARWRSASEIACELEFLLHLAAKGVSVAMPIEARDGRRMRPLAAPEGVRQLVVFTYADGQPLSWSDERHCHLAGQLVARIHAAGDDFCSSHARFRLDLDYLLETPLTLIQQMLAHRPADWRYVDGVAARLRTAVEAATRNGLDRGMCHADLEAKNVHVTADGRMTVLDFDYAGAGWRAIDLVPAYQNTTVQNRAGHWDAFASGYTATRRLGADDLAAVPLFAGLREIWGLGVTAYNAMDRGSLFIAENKLDYWLRCLRNWETRYFGGPSR